MFPPPQKMAVCSPSGRWIGTTRRPATTRVWWSLSSQYQQTKQMQCHLGIICRLFCAFLQKYWNMAIPLIFSRIDVTLRRCRFTNFSVRIARNRASYWCDPVIFPVKNARIVGRLISRRSFPSSHLPLRYKLKPPFNALETPVRVGCASEISLFLVR